MGRIVKTVVKSSIAHKLGIAPGDILLRINGERIQDLIDYEYNMADSQLLLLFAAADGEEYEAEIEKEPNEDIGIIFTDDGLGEKITCRNRCQFCFIDQLPKNMRKTLYFKDDDWRFSFLMGNYITLTNLSEEEIGRIIRQRISPLYVSIHASDDDVRSEMLRNSSAGRTFDLVRRMTEEGISMHTQVVLCEGINDREVLQRTIEDLYALHPGVLSLAVVPVGLTKHREGLSALRPVTAQTAIDTLQGIHVFQDRFLKERGTRFVFAADELYLKAKIAFPPFETYEDFPQIENGVGMVEKFSFEIQEALVTSSPARSAHRNKIAVVTGKSYYPLMCENVRLISEKTGVKTYVYAVENNFFGESVTVTGLLTARDIIGQLKGRIHEDILLLSASCFHESSNTTLDDISLEELSSALGVECRKIEPDGRLFVEQVIGIQKKTEN
jgi:putative radical SAM enzyme (TIGR03279 family)